VQDRAFTLACVVDNHPRFFTELVLWAHCVERHIPRSGFIPIVYFVGHPHAELCDWLSSKKISHRSIDPIVPGSPHCNKIAPFVDAHATDYTIVSDVDLFFVRDPSNLFGSDRIRAAPNNHCNPPDFIYKRILAASGLNRPYRSGMSLYRGNLGLRETHINHISAGIVGLPCSKSRGFAARWKHWAEWLVANRSILEQWGKQVDQVAFCLAAEDIQEDVEFLPAQVNTILQSLDEIATVYAFHLTSGHIPNYPHLFNADKTMKATGFSQGVNDALSMLNDCIGAAVRDILSLSATRDHLANFLNPQWRR
jgi:hypothetical protein